MRHERLVGDKRIDGQISHCISDCNKFDLLQEIILKSSRFMGIAFGILVLVFLGSTTSPCAPSPIQFFERNSTGVTLYSNGGAVQIDVCSDRIVHVIASPTPKIPPAIVPTVIHLCRNSNFKVVSDKSTVAIRTAAFEISIDRETGALRFLSADGKSLLSEPRDGKNSYSRHDRRNADLPRTTGVFDSTG